ncbi:MAG: Ig-like domain-containing protein [Lysobacteraceae bacterium]
MKRFLILGLLVPALVLATGFGRVPRTAAVPDTAQVEPGGSVLIDVLANDGEVLGPDLTLVAIRSVTEGQAVIEDNQVRYTAPAQPSADSTRFAYSVQRADGQLAIGTVTVTFVTPSITLSGFIAGVQADCTVQAHVGGSVVTGACAGEPGRFSVAVPTAEADALVRIQAQVTRVQDGQADRMFSLLGRLGDLQAAAGEDQSLDETQWPALTVNNYTTAHHAVLAVANDGQAVSSVGDFRRLHGAADEWDVHVRASLLHGLSAGVVGALSPYPDHYAAIADSAHARALESAANQGQFPGYTAVWASDAMAMQPGGVVAWPEPAPGDVLVGRLGANPGTINVRRIGGFVLDIGSDGFAGLYRPLPNPEPELTVALDEAGSIVFSNVVPPVSLSTFTLDCDDGTPRMFTARFREVALSLRRMVAPSPDLQDLALLRAFAFVDNLEEVPEGCGSPSLADRDFVQTVQLVGPAVAEGFVDGAPQGRWSVTLADAAFESQDTVNAKRAGIVDFDLNTVELAGYLPTLDWSMDAGGRVVLSLMREEGGPVTVRLSRLDGDGRGGESLVSEATNLDGVSSAGTFLAMRQSAPDLFVDAPELIEGDWLSGFDIHEAGRALDDGSRFYLRFGLAPGFGERLSILADGTRLPSPFGYAIEDGVLVMRTYVSGGFSYPECPEGSGDACYLFQLRTWQPALVDVDGGENPRLYVLEHIEFFNPDGSLIVRSVRNNFYEPALVPEPDDLQAQPLPVRSLRR